jgi:hypothetical protein
MSVGPLLLRSCSILLTPFLQLHEYNRMLIFDGDQPREKSKIKLKHFSCVFSVRRYLLTLNSQKKAWSLCNLKTRIDLILSENTIQCVNFCFSKKCFFFCCCSDTMKLLFLKIIQLLFLLLIAQQPKYPCHWHTGAFPAQVCRALWSIDCCALSQNTFSLQTIWNYFCTTVSSLLVFVSNIRACINSLNIASSFLDSYRT